MKKKAWSISTREMVFCALFAALVAAGAFIRIPLPGVPFTLQTTFVTLAGLLLGRRLGAISVGVYLLVGLVGIPVFTQGGGPSYIFQPTFGYLMGFCLGAYLTGRIAEKSRAGFGSDLVASLVGLAAVYALGTVYYYLIVHYYLGQAVGARALLVTCCLMTLPGDLFSCALCAAVARRLRAALGARAFSRPTR